MPEAVAFGKAVIVEGPRIVAVVDTDALSGDIDVVDVEGRYTAPGLIDIHTHGAVGRSFNEPSAEAWATITDRNAACGITSLLATLATASIDDLVACLRLARAGRSAPLSSRLPFRRTRRFCSRRRSSSAPRCARRLRGCRALDIGF